MSTVRIHPNKHTMAALRKAARKHETTESAVVAAIVRTVMREDLLDAIMDGARIDAGATRINRDGWTAERVAKMLKLRDEGCTYAEIARSLGVTKNAVSGKLWRI